MAQRARQLEVVVERVPHTLISARTGKEPIEVTWVDSLKSSGIHRNRLVAKEFRRGSKVHGFTNFSATPPLEELVKLVRSLVATSRWDRAAWIGEDEHQNSSEIVVMHTDISRAYFHARSKAQKCVELPTEMWSGGSLECGRLRVSLYGTRDAAANWEDACAKVLQAHQFERGVACR